MRGRVLHVDGDTVWLARGLRLLKSSDGGKSWHCRALLPTASPRESLAVHRLGRRLGRVGFHHFVATGTDTGVVIAHKQVFAVQQGQAQLIRQAALVGSRPLALSAGCGMICYGEYRSNPQRSPVSVWGAAADEPDRWEPVWTFTRARHVHGVYFDAHSGHFWVTTGDANDESALWVTTDGFRTLDYVVGGSQRYRAVQLLFTREHVYFGSDAPDEPNYISRLERSTGNTELLAEVAGPVFYGCNVGEAMFFSTVVEPSKTNLSPYVELWQGAPTQGWRILRRFRKDGWPARYFQYGQVLFPTGPGDGKNLWITPFATRGDQQTIRMPLSAPSSVQ